MKRNEIKKRIVMIKIYLDRALSLVSWGKNLILIIAGAKYIMNWNISQTIILSLGLIAFLIALGYLDINKINLYQTEVEINTNLNPYFKKLARRKKWDTKNLEI